MKTDAVSSRNDIDVFTRILHLGLILFGLLALATGDFADDYREAGGLGFMVHGWIGIGVAFLIGSRLTYGIVGPLQARFTHWIPCTKERLKLVREDLMGLMRLRLPDRQPRQGVAALVEISGLLLFLFLAVTGAFTFFTIGQGQQVHGTTRFMKEIHEAGAVLLPLFFLGHGGAVLLHAMAGKHLWRKMIFLKDN